MKRIKTLDALHRFALPGIALINIRQMVHRSMEILQADYPISTFIDEAVMDLYYVIF